MRPRILLLLAALLFLAACAAPTPTPTPAPTAPPTPEPTPAPYTAMSGDGEHPQLVAHAGGAVYGYRYTNSLEALNAAYAVGFRYVELDFELTSDGEIVLIHDWEAMSLRLLGKTGPLSLREFRGRKALAGLTLLDLKGLLDWLEAHPDCAVITDVKSEENPAVLASIREAAGDLAGRFIPQAYAPAEAAALLDDGWERVILTLYRTELTPEELADFLAETPLWAVTVPQERMSPALADAVGESGTALYCHTVNALDFFDEWKDRGLTGIYTDYFQPLRWIY
jgi:glycerophosphoryl diester phosphodiesterase